MAIDLNKMIDVVFGIMLLLLFLVCIVLVLIKGVFAPEDTDVLSKGINSALGSGGASGAAMLYMKWRVIRGTKANLTSDQVMELLKDKKKDEE